jgi:hypothetical protein
MDLKGEHGLAETAEKPGYRFTASEAYLRACGAIRS